MRRVGVVGSTLFMVVALSVGVAACGNGGYGASSSGGGGGATDTVAPAPAGGAAAVTIAGYSFSVSGPVTAGTPFTVSNTDGVTHTFTNPDGAFDVSVAGGASEQVTIATPGTYQFICKIHSSMKGTITVE